MSNNSFPITFIKGPVILVSKSFISWNAIQESQLSKPLRILQLTTHDTRCPKKNKAVELLKQRATALFFFGHPVHIYGLLWLLVVIVAKPRYIEAKVTQEPYIQHLLN